MLLKKLALIGGCCSIIFAAQSTFASSYTVNKCISDAKTMNETILSHNIFKTKNCPSINKEINTSKKNITLVTGKGKSKNEQLCEATCYNGSKKLACNWQPRDFKNTLACPPAPQ
jgi:hypothetical protein